MMRSPTKKPNREVSYSAKAIAEALDFTAYVVVTYGEVYLPIYARLERELKLARERERLLARVKARLGRGRAAP